MSDKEIIIKSLKKVERRLRRNRLLTDLTFGLSLFLLFPLGFKIIDLVSPFRGRTVVAVLGVWVLCVIGYFIWRTREKGTLAQAAADVDSRAALSDELKSAYWFINNPRASQWIDAQIQRAAEKAGGLNIERLYPRSIPKTSWLALALFVLVIALNFVPIPWNNNWVLLQAAPAFSLTDSEQALLDEAEEALANTDLAERVREIMQQLKDGTITADEALQQLEALQEELGQGDLDMAAIDAALDEVAAALATSPELAEIAEALRDMDVADAAELLKDLAEEATAEEMTNMQSSLEQASENARKSLDDLAEELKDATSRRPGKLLPKLLEFWRSWRNNSRIRKSVNRPRNNSNSFNNLLRRGYRPNNSRVRMRPPSQASRPKVENPCRAAACRARPQALPVSSREIRSREATGVVRTPARTRPDCPEKRRISLRSNWNWRFSSNRPV
jgi:hypothetical protein